MTYMYGIKHLFMPISTVLKLILRRKHVINLSHHYYTVFLSTQALRSYSDVVSGPVDAADGHAQAAQAALVHVTGDGAAYTQRAQQGVPALRERERKRSEEAGDRCLKRILEGLCSQTPQSSQHSIRPVWKSEGWNLPGWLVTAMITNTT